MTKHEELIEKVANAICESRHDEFNWWHTLDEVEKHQFREEAKAAIITILTALQDPNKQMLCDGYIAAERDICLEDGEIQSVIGRSVWQAMLNASPLSGEKRGAE